MGAEFTGDESRYARAVEMLGKTVTTGELPPPPSSAFNAMSLAKGVAYGAMGPASLLVSPLVDLAEGKLDERARAEQHAAGIRQLAEAGVPGFSYRETPINGKTETIAVDATAQIEGPRKKPWVYSTASLSDPEVQKMAGAQVQETQASLSEYQAQHKAAAESYGARSQKYESDLQGYLDKLQYGDAATKEAAVSPGARPVPPLSFADQLSSDIRQQQVQVETEIKANAAAPAASANTIQGLGNLSTKLEEPAVAEVAPAPAEPVMRARPASNAPTAAGP